MRKTDFRALLTQTEHELLMAVVGNSGQYASVWADAFVINDTITHDSFAAIVGLLWDNGLIDGTRQAVLLTYQPATDAQIDVPLLTDQE